MGVVKLLIDVVDYLVSYAAFILAGHLAYNVSTQLFIAWTTGGIVEWSDALDVVVTSARAFATTLKALWNGIWFVSKTFML